MNDRIRELLVESGFCFWADEEWGPGPGKISWDCDYEKEMEKFVELLVRECAVTVANAEGICGVTAESITTHFGIEDRLEEFENWCKESGDGSAE